MDRSRDINRLFARQLVEGIEGASLVEMPIEKSITLFPWLEAGEEVAGLVEEFLTGSPATHACDRILATVLFTDVVQSTEQAVTLGDRRWRAVLDRHDSIIARELARFRGRFVKSMGGGVLATFDGPARAVHCAAALRDSLFAAGVSVRTGIHTGEIELRDDDIGGVAVHIASRVITHASSGEILTSSTVKDLVVGSDIVFDDRGEHELKGVPGRWRLFAAEPGM